MMINHDDAMAALCVWEAMLEGREKLPHLNDRFAEIGTVAMRSEAIDMGAFANRVYDAMPAHIRDDAAFDWEVVPAIVETRYASLAGAHMTDDQMAFHVVRKLGHVPPMAIAGHDGAFIALRLNAKRYMAGDWQGVTDDAPANLFSVEARRTDGTCAVLTDHGTLADAQNAALLLSALIGLPLEKIGGAA